MSVATRIRFLVRNLLRRRQADRDLEAELAAYAAEMQPRLQRRLPVEGLREEVRAARLGAGLEGWAHDLRHAARTLRQAPLFALACIATFALGIGANAVVFSMANAFLFRPPPIPHPEQVYFVRVVLPPRATGDAIIAAADLADLRRQAAPVFSDAAEDSLQQLGLSVAGQAQSLWAMYVTPDFFRLLRVPPARGRFFSGDGEPAVVLSYACWQSHFGARPDLIGHVANLQGRAVTIVGIAPRGFHGPSSLVDIEAYVPMGLADSQTLDTSKLVRLRPSVGRVAGEAALARFAQTMASEHPAADRGIALHLMPLGVGLHFGTQQNPFSVAATLFLGLSGLVLLLAAANVMGLLLARASTRRREMAVRAAVGGTRRRLARQVFLETLLLALAGGVAGMLLGAAGSRALSALPPDLGIPIVLDFSFDWRVCIYGLAMAALVALAAGLGPAWRAAGADPSDALRSDRSGTDRRRQRLRSALVAGQMAGSLALLIAAGLFVRSLRQAEHARLGFDPSEVWNFSLDAAAGGYAPARGPQYFAQALARARAVPGVAAASLAAAVPFGMESYGGQVRLGSGATAAGAPWLFADRIPAADGYLATLGVPLLRGRWLQASDTAATAAVAVVNQTMAERYWPGQNPLGQTLVRRVGPARPLQVVGVVGDVRARFTVPVEPTLYTALAQDYMPQQVLQVRFAAGAAAPAAVARSLRQLDAKVPFTTQSMDEAMEGLGGLYPFRLGARLATWLGLLGLVLALVGVYGVVAYNAAQRTHEIGVRMALGARHRQVVGAILRQSVAVVAIGMGLGLLLAAALGKLVGALLVGVSGLDPLTFSLAALVLGTVAMAAAIVPAWRAAGADPLAALRCE